MTATISYGGHYTDVTLSVKADDITDSSVVSAIIVTCGKETYALRHVQEVWRKTELGWNWKELDGSGLAGKTIDTLTYYLQDGQVYKYNVNQKVKVPAADELSAKWENRKTLRVTGLPKDIENPKATVKTQVGRDETATVIAEAVAVNKDVITTRAAEDGKNYAITIVSDNYADISALAAFTMSDEEKKEVAAINEAVASAKTAITAAAVDATYPAANVKAVNDAKAALEKLIADDSATAARINAAAATLNTAMDAAKKAKAAADAAKEAQQTPGQTTPAAPVKPAATDPVVGKTYTVSGQKYKVTAAAAVTFTASKNAKSVTVPATVSIGGKKLAVTAIGSKAFKKKVQTVTLKTMKLTKKTVKNSLKGSRVKTIKVKVGSKKQNKTYVKKYAKIFTKANAGKKVTVK